jgi:acyl carrier protein
MNVDATMKTSVRDGKSTAAKPPAASSSDFYQRADALKAEQRALPKVVRASMPAPDEIYSKVARVLVDSLNVDEGDVTPTATLQGDLGAESIDFLDIVFRLEREFSIRIPRGELFPESIFEGDPDFVREGRVTDLGMVELRSRMPFADLTAVDEDRRLAAVSDLFTVGLVTRYTAWKLGLPAGFSPNSPAGR